MKKTILSFILMCGVMLTACEAVNESTRVEKFNTPFLQDLSETEEITIYYIEPNNVIAKIDSPIEMNKVLSMFNDWDAESNITDGMDSACNIVIQFDDEITIYYTENNVEDDLYYGRMKGEDGKMQSYLFPAEFGEYINELYVNYCNK